MDIFETIKNRRSHRSFLKNKIPTETLEKLIYHASLAPSPKNRQPWRIILLQEKSKNAFVTFTFECLEILKKQEKRYGSLEISLNAMREANALCVVYNPFTEDTTPEELNRWQRSDLQAIGAMIQNLMLSATAHNIGSLWINDFYFIEREIGDWLRLKADIIAVVALGNFDSIPFMKRRKSLQDILEIRR